METFPKKTCLNTFGFFSISLKIDVRKQMGFFYTNGPYVTKFKKGKMIIITH